MKNIERFVYGLAITAAIFSTATFVSARLHLDVDFIPDFFVTLTIELLLSAIAIYAMRNYLIFRFSIPHPKTLIKPVVFALLATIAINGVLTILTKMLGGKIEVPEALAKLKPVQVLIFVFFYASIAEEMLFRGFLLNLLKPLEKTGFSVLKRYISLPVIVSAVAFGMAHLILITTGVSLLFVARIVVFTTCLGTIAGYYQEKHDNHAYAIIVHMSGNLLAVIAAFAMH